MFRPLLPEQASLLRACRKQKTHDVVPIRPLTLLQRLRSHRLNTSTRMVQHSPLLCPRERPGSTDEAERRMAAWICVWETGSHSINRIRRSQRTLLRELITTDRNY